MKKDKDDASDAFGKMVATEMKSMSAHIKFRFNCDKYVCSYKVSF